jgi:hypothetical protein
MLNRQEARMGGPGPGPCWEWLSPGPRSLRALFYQRGKSQTWHQFKREERASYGSIESATEKLQEVITPYLVEEWLLVEEGAKQKQTRKRREVQELFKQR